MNPFAFRFRSLYCRVNEGDYVDAIVTYRKWQYGTFDEKVKLDAGVASTNMMLRKPLYEHRLQLDLWIVVVGFRWRDK